MRSPDRVVLASARRDRFRPEVCARSGPDSGAGGRVLRRQTLNPAPRLASPGSGDQQVRRRARRRPLVRAPRRARGRNRERRRRLCRGGTQPVLWPRGRFGRRRRRRVICRRRSCGRACGSPVRPVDRRAPVLGSAAVAEAIAAPREPDRRKRSPGPGTPAATRIP
jgi:hypothetical protein